MRAVERDAQPRRPHARARRGGSVVDRRLIDDVLAVARIPAPTFQEGERIEWLESRLAGLPGDRSRDGVGNLVWRWGDEPPRVAVAAHVDTVFAEGTKLEPAIDGTWLVGPGVGDNAAAVAVAVHVVERLLGSRPVAAGAVAFTVGEEGLGNLRGAHAFCEAFRPKAFVALEGHGLDTVIVDAVGSIRARVVVEGPGGHSWEDRGAPSAVHALFELGRGLVALGESEAPVNVGLIGGGRSVNTIADRAELVVERRSLDEAPLAAFSSALGGLEAPPPLAASAEVLGRRPAGRLPRDSPLLEAVRRVRAELGLADELDAGSTDANAALARGIPALALGVGRGSGMHTLGERIDGASLEAGARQLELLLVALLGDDAA